MSDDRARGFLEDIIAHPDDDAPRLIYADWLEERGDPRGAFIRMQVELARAPLDDPRRPEWEFRVHDLLEDHEEEWLGPVGERVVGWQFRRGFVDAVEMSLRDFLEHGEELTRLTPLRHLRPGVAYTTYPGQGAARIPQPEDAERIPQLAKCPALRHIDTLDLSHTPLSDEDLAALAASPNLRCLTALDLAVQVRPSTIPILAESPLATRLTSLSLARSVAEAELAALSAASFPRLRALDLSDCSWVSAWHHLARATWLPQLTSLHLGGNAIRAEDLVLLLSSPRLGNLEHLDLRPQFPTQLGTRILETLLGNAHLSRLARVCLDGHVAEPQAVHDFVASPSLPALTALRLNRLDLRPAGLRLLLEGLRIRAERGYPGLRALGLGHNRLGAGARALAECPALANLVALELNNNGIRDSDVEVLAKSPHLGRLTTLNFANNAFGLRGVQAMADSSTFGNLSRVNLGFTAGIESAARWALSTSAKLPWLLDIQFATHYAPNSPDLFSDWWGFPKRVHFRRRPAEGR
jgi:uncharacterized protein (TIGR02996 family)